MNLIIETHVNDVFPLSEVFVPVIYFLDVFFLIIFFVDYFKSAIENEISGLKTFLRAQAIINSFITQLKRR